MCQNKIYATKVLLNGTGVTTAVNEFLLRQKGELENETQTNENNSNKYTQNSSILIFSAKVT